MSNLKFEDINDWTPSSISIVDEPSHPCCHFEVYPDDEEYVKKSIGINEGEMMVEQNPQPEEPMVHAPASFLEKILGRTVGKAVETETPAKPPVKEEEEKPADSNLEARLAKLEARVAKLEKQEPPKEEEEEKEPAPGAVTKSETAESSEAESTTETTEEIVDKEEVVAKSKSIDPDTVTTSSSETRSLTERAGRNSNGMTW